MSTKDLNLPWEWRLLKREREDEGKSLRREHATAEVERREQDERGCYYLYVLPVHRCPPSVVECGVNWSPAFTSITHAALTLTDLVQGARL